MLTFSQSMTRSKEKDNYHRYVPVNHQFAAVAQLYEPIGDSKDNSKDGRCGDLAGDGVGDVGKECRRL